jgi:hypothetical protein
MALKPHQERVVAEQIELADKIAKLTAFINGPRWGTETSPPERSRLRRQLAVMEQYDAILLERIGAFEV